VDAGTKQKGLSFEPCFHRPLSYWSMYVNAGKKQKDLSFKLVFCRQGTGECMWMHKLQQMMMKP
jgi:hypothetical protein